MRKIPLIAFACAATSLYGHDYYCPRNDIVLFADYTYLKRHQERDFRLVENTRVLNDPKEVLDTGDLNEAMQCQSGLKMGILLDHDACTSLELFYTWVCPWNAKKTLRDPGFLSYPFKELRDNLVGFVNADSVAARYKSHLQNAELNYWIHLTPQYVDYFSFSLDMGLRYISLIEHFRLNFSQAAGTARYRVKTNNHLWGLQLGAMLEINPTCYWTWSFIFKSAAFANKVNDRVEIEDPLDGGAPPSRSHDKLVPTGLVEGCAQLAFHASDFLSFTVGYDGFLLFGVALATHQRELNRTSISGLRTSGEMWVHGFYTGANLRF